MKKISLICAVALAGLSLTACGSNSNKKTSSSSKVSSSKVVKHHKKAKHSKKKASSSSNSSAASASNQQNQQQNNSGDQADPFDASTWDKPYKGYPSFNAYLHDHPDTPNIQSQTAQIQHDENVRKGIEDANGNETQNFKNWVSARDNAWDNGNDNFPDYDQNRQW
ncbi:hypothetical protein [Limosilactobacillus coleohominis]|nr:hypothetical protein [Limosilactobacillus coleohominis]